MKVAIIKYNAGNIHSVRLALQRLGIDPVVSNSPETIIGADKVIFPGVGEASSAMAYLKERNLDQVILKLTQPVLGICLGLQLMCRHSEENNTECLGIFDTGVFKFPPKDKVPHMGWNTVSNLNGSLFSKIENENYVYFVHSYYAELAPESIAQTNYIFPFSSGLQKNNFYAVQFHPEKSGSIGECILKNFIKL